MRLTNESNYTKALILSFFGHELDPQIIEDCKEVRESDPWTNELRKTLDFLPYIIVPEYYMDLFDKNVHKMTDVFDKNCETSYDILSDIMKKTFSLIEVFIIPVFLAY